MRVYYNEIDANAAAWLRALIDAGYLPAGDVDTRSIVDVRGADLLGYDQCHFFAGIGGWPHALDLAKWNGPVWTGSCPCQPFSAAGKRRGTADERHLWPEFRRLIAECHPPVVFGEQVASKDGRLWLTGVRADLEALGYAVGAADLCAAGVGAPHIRQRLFWVADGDGGQSWNRRLQPGGQHGQQPEDGGAGAEWLGDAAGSRRQNDGRSASSPAVGLVSELSSVWSDAFWLSCLDGKARRIEPGSFPLAHGVPARVGRLRGYGNAIVPQVAAEFVGAYLDVA